MPQGGHRRPDTGNDHRRQKDCDRFDIGSELLAHQSTRHGAHGTEPDGTDRNADAPVGLTADNSADHGECNSGHKGEPHPCDEPFKPAPGSDPTEHLVVAVGLDFDRSSADEGTVTGENDAERETAHTHGESGKTRPMVSCLADDQVGGQPDRTARGDGNHNRDQRRDDLPCDVPHVDGSPSLVASPARM